MGNDGDKLNGDKPRSVKDLRGTDSTESAYTLGRMAETTVFYTIGEVIKRLMPSRGIGTAKELAERTKTETLPPINKDTISRLLNGVGTPERVTVERLARVFDLHAEDIYERQRRLDRPADRSGVSNFPARRMTDHTLDARVIELAKQIAQMENPGRVIEVALQISMLDNAARVVQLAQQLAELSGPARLAVEAFLVALDEAGATKRRDV